jgi:DNA polymerase-3 subunit delta
MQLAPAQLSQHLQRGLRPLYTLFGDEPLLVQEAADAIRAAARTQGYTERTVHTVAGAHFDWSAVGGAGGAGGGRGGGQRRLAADGGKRRGQ